MLKQIILTVFLISLVSSSALKISADDLPAEIKSNLMGLFKGVLNVKDSEQCVACVSVATYVKSFLNEDSTEEELKGVILKACSLFSPEIKAQV